MPGEDFTSSLPGPLFKHTLEYDGIPKDPPPRKKREKKIEVDPYDTLPPELKELPF